MGTGGRLLSVVVALAVVVVVSGYPVYVSPRTQEVTSAEPVDAVIALGGPIDSALYAEQLARAGATENLVLSEGFGDQWREQIRICKKTTTTEYRTTCFKPEPLTTRGEARSIRELAEANGWKRIAVVVPKYHVERTRLIVGRCFDGELDLVTPPDLETGPGEWAYQYAYQTAAFAKAAVLRGC